MTNHTSMPQGALTTQGAFTPTGAESWDDLRDRFTTVLGLHERVPSAVLQRAMVDETYAHRLMVSRGSPAMLAALLRDKRNQQYDVPVDPPARPAVPASATAPARSTLSLAAHAAAALVKWGKAGFTQVDADTYARRTSACETCPHLLEPPDRIAYSIRLKKGEDLRACGLCGCVASRKARLPTESCPDRDPLAPHLSRWGEQAAGGAA